MTRDEMLILFKVNNIGHLVLILLNEKLALTFLNF